MSFALLILLNIFLGGMIYLALNLKLARLTEEGISRKLKKDFTSIVDEFNQTADANISLLENRIDSLKNILSSLDLKIQKEWRDNDSFQLHTPKVSSSKKEFPPEKEIKSASTEFAATNPAESLTANVKNQHFAPSGKKTSQNSQGNPFFSLKKIFQSFSALWSSTFPSLALTGKKIPGNSFTKYSAMETPASHQKRSIKEKNPGIQITKNAHDLPESLLNSGFSDNEPVKMRVGSHRPETEEIPEKYTPLKENGRFDFISEEMDSAIHQTLWEAEKTELEKESRNHNTLPTAFENKEKKEKHREEPWENPDEDEIIFEQKIPLSAFAKNSHPQRGEKPVKVKDILDYETVDILNDKTATLPSDFWKMNKDQRFQYIAGLVRQGFPVRDLSALTHMSLGEIELIASLNKD